MPEESKGPNEPSNSSAQSEPQLPPAPRLPVSPQNEVPTTTETNNSSSNPPESATARELHWLEKLNFAGQLSLVVVGIIAAYIYHGQLKVMQGQLDQMRGSSVQTDQLIRLNQQQVAELTKQAADTYELAEAAKRTFAANRPTVIINSVSVTMFPDLKGFRYELTVVNDGMVAATKVVGGCESFVGNKPLALALNYSAKPITIGTRDIIGVCGGNVRPDIFGLLKSGDATFDIYIHAAYEGPGGRYKYCDKQRYAPEFNVFANMGECDASKPFPQ